MKKSKVFIVSFLNLLISSFLILDNVLPHQVSEISYYSSIYGFSEKSTYGRKPAIDFKIILELKNDKRYRLGFNPEDNSFIKGNKIIVYESLFSNNVNYLRIENKVWKKYYCGLLRNYSILIPFIFSFLVSILSFKFYKNKFIQLSLVGSIMFLPILFFIYNFYF